MQKKQFNPFNRNVENRNFGLGSRDMARALITANRMAGNADSTQDSDASKIRDFAKYLKSEGIRDLRDIEKCHIQGYAANLIERYENGEFRAGSVQGYISTVNRTMAIARRDEKCTVNPVSDAGAPKRTGIADRDHSVSKQAHIEAQEAIPERLSVQLDLQREIGLRFKESCLINAQKVLEIARATGVLEIDDGTKGGRPREFTVTSDSQLDALKRAAEIQGNHYSMVPDHQNFAQYQNECYRKIAETNVKFHGERHCYANDRYYAISGVESPVRAGVEHNQHHRYIAEKLGISVAEARDLDKTWRLQVSIELGHARTDVTNSYLG